MATVSTERAERPPAIDTLLRRWRWALGVLTVLGFLGLGGVAIVDFLNGAYLRSFSSVTLGLALGVQPGFFIEGRNFQKGWARHPWIVWIFVSLVLSSGLATALDWKRSSDQLRAAESQARVQAAHPVKGPR